jgi:hypothetical protein
MEEIHIIRSNRKWGVHNFKKDYRSLRNFKYRDIAFHYAARYKSSIVVHNSDGSVDFVFNNESD